MSMCRLCLRGKDGLDNGQYAVMGNDLASLSIHPATSVELDFYEFDEIKNVATKKAYEKSSKQPTHTSYQQLSCKED